MVRTRRKPADPNQPPRAIIYTRLSKAKTGSTKEGADRNTEASLDTQRAGCEANILGSGGQLIATEHDVAAGDRIDNRQGLFRAIERIRNGEADTLIVHSLDRLSRDTMQQAGITHEVRRAGGRVMSATEPNFEQGALGDALTVLLGVASAVELTRIRERVNRSLDAKFAQQKRYKPARRPPYGYRKLGTGDNATYTIDPAESLIVQRVFAERAAGKSVRQIILGLREDGIPTPSGSGQWGTHSVQGMLERDVYWSGQHEVWRTQTVRDVDNVPYLEPRPAEERYTVPFPAFVDSTIAQQARTAGERNRWKSHRHDRNDELGIGRYGFFRCSGCGRALTLMKPKVGNPKYACASRYHLSRPCPQPTSISMDKLDLPVWFWVQAVLEDPDNADAWLPTMQVPDVDAMALRALAEAEQQVAALEGRITNRLANLALLTGSVAQLEAREINRLNDELEQARMQRDRLADAMPKAAEPVPTMMAVDAVARATKLAVDAMRAADPAPASEHTLEIATPKGIMPVKVPQSWAAKRAAMSVLGVSVTLNQTETDAPRWVAEMRLPDGMVLHGHDAGSQWFQSDHNPGAYLFPSSRYSG